MYLCAEWEAEKGGRMGCLMKEKIQGLAERKAFILLFVIVWELCSSSGNLTYREIIARPAFLVNLHTAMVCMFPPPPFLNPSKRKNISLESSEILNVNTGEFFPMNLSTLVYMQLLFYSVESLCISGE
jgi:hypothetical protein